MGVYLSPNQEIEILKRSDVENIIKDICKKLDINVVKDAMWVYDKLAKNEDNITNTNPVPIAVDCVYKMGDGLNARDVSFAGGIPNYYYKIGTTLDPIAHHLIHEIHNRRRDSN